MAEILIVDDEESDRLQMAAALKPLGHKLHFAANAVEATELYLERPIHAVVTDIVMAGGDGLQLIANLKALKPDVTVIAVSGKSPSGLSAATSFGADAVLTKPLVAEALVQAVTAALRPRRAPEDESS